MGIFISVIIFILVLVIMALLQLKPGTFALFYHYALGKYSIKKTDSLSLSFILGAESFTAILLLIIYLITFAIFMNQPSFIQDIFSWIMTGILLGEAIAMFFFYFRKGKSTILFISRRVAKGIKTCASHTTSHQNAFILGAISNVPELIFTIPLYIIFSLELMKFSTGTRILFAFIFILFTILPLFFIHYLYHTGNNLAEIQRLRVRLKPTIRTLIGISFVILAIATIDCGVFCYG